MTPSSVTERAYTHAVPQPAAGDQRRLDHLGVAGGALLRRQRVQGLGVDEDGGGLVVGADVVLGLGQVDAGLAAVGGVDLGDQGGGHVHDRHAALVGRGAEAGEVADHAAAERDHVVGAGQARAHELGPHDLGVGHGLGLLAGHDAHAAGQRLEPVGEEPAHGAVGDQEAPTVGGPAVGGVGEQAVAQQHRVLGRGRPGPQQPGVLRAAREVDQRGQRPQHGVGRPVEHDGVGGGLVGALAIVEQAREARRRSRASGRSSPSSVARVQQVSTSTSSQTTRWRRSASRTRLEPRAPPPSATTDPGAAWSSAWATATSSRSRNASSPCSAKKSGMRTPSSRSSTASVSTGSTPQASATVRAATVLPAPMKPAKTSARSVSGDATRCAPRRRAAAASTSSMWSPPNLLR